MFTTMVAIMMEMLMTVRDEVTDYEDDGVDSDDDDLDEEGISENWMSCCYLPEEISCLKVPAR